MQHVCTLSLHRQWAQHLTKKKRFKLRKKKWFFSSTQLLLLVWIPPQQNCALTNQSTSAMAGELRKEGIKDRFLKACIRDRTLQQLFTARLLSIPGIITLNIAMQHSIIMLSIALSISKDEEVSFSFSECKSVYLFIYFCRFIRSTDAIYLTCSTKWTNSKKAFHTV